MPLNIRIQNQHPVPLCRYVAFLQAIPGHTRAKEFPFVFQLVISFSVFFLSVCIHLFTIIAENTLLLNITLLQVIFYLIMETEY